MSDKLFQILAQYGAFKYGCERALDLLTNPDASEFDADKVIRILKTVLEE